MTLNRDEIRKNVDRGKFVKNTRFLKSHRT